MLWASPASVAPPVPGRSSQTFAENMSLRSQSMICRPMAFTAKDRLLPQTIWRGRDFQPENGVMTDPIDIDTMREGIASEHGIPSGVRPLPEKYIPEPRLDMISGSPNPALASTRQERMKSSRMNSTLQKSSQTQATFHAPSDYKRKSANRAIDLTLHRRHVRCYGLRPHLPRHRFRAGHRRRSPK